MIPHRSRSYGCSNDKKKLFLTNAYIYFKCLRVIQLQVLVKTKEKAHQGNVKVEGMGIFVGLCPLAQTWFRMAEFNGFQSRDISALSQCAGRVAPPDHVLVSGRGGWTLPKPGSQGAGRRSAASKLYSSPYYSAVIPLLPIPSWSRDEEGGPHKA